MILVTGANGFIGSALVWELNQSGITDITCVDTVGLQQRPELLQKRKYSRFLLKDQLWDFLNSKEAQKIQWILHMGANSSTTEKNWEHLYENNTFYTQRIFEWCARHGKNLIYASSAATYGAGELGYNDNTDSEQLRPLNLYGDSKVQFDRWAARQSVTPPNWYGLKFFNVYGPNEYHKENMSSLVYKSFHQILKTNQVQLFKSYLSQFKDGEQLRDFVYVKDVTTWILELIQKKPTSGIYNMGFGVARSWLEMTGAIFSAMNKAKKIEFIDMPESIRNQYQYFTEANMQKWQSRGLSKPRWSVEDGVRDYVQNYLQKSDSYL